MGPPPGSRRRPNASVRGLFRLLSVQISSGNRNCTVCSRPETSATAKGSKALTNIASRRISPLAFRSIWNKVPSKSSLPTVLRRQILRRHPVLQRVYHIFRCLIYEMQKHAHRHRFRPAGDEWIDLSLPSATMPLRYLTQEIERKIQFAESTMRRSYCLRMPANAWFGQLCQTMASADTHLAQQRI